MSESEVSRNAGNDIPNITIIDGGFSSQMSCHVKSSVDGDPLWSARYLQTNPDEIISTHLDFLRAGADVVTTNTYQAWIGGFIKHLQVSPVEGYALIKRAVELAKRARKTYLEECGDAMPPERTPLIVGSVGPYGAHLHDGSEYNGNYIDKTNLEIIREWHKPRIEALIESGVDLLAFETIPCELEAILLVNMLKEYQEMKAWLSFSCADNNNLVHGEDFQTTAKKIWDSTSQLVAIGVNCCAPTIVANLFKGINDGRQSPIPLIAYPNSGEKYNPDIGWMDRDKCVSLETFVPEWLDLGVRYVGGCCRTYGADIMRIRTQVQNWIDLKRFHKLNKHLQ